MNPKFTFMLTYRFLFNQGPFKILRQPCLRFKQCTKYFVIKDRVLQQSHSSNVTGSPSNISLNCNRFLVLSCTLHTLYSFFHTQQRLLLNNKGQKTSKKHGLVGLVLFCKMRKNNTKQHKIMHFLCPRFDL